MAAELIIAPEAKQDLTEAYAWYEGRRSGLGEEFLSCVDACIEAIRRTPEMYTVVHYAELEEAIWSVAVAHGRCRPDYWSRRRVE